MPVAFDSEAFARNRTFNSVHVDTGMVDNADYMGFYGEQAENWERKAADVKLSIKVREAEVADETRRELGKATEGVVTSKIHLDERWQSLNKALNVANEQAGLYVMANRTMNERGQMIRSYNASRRVEMTSLSPSHNVDTTDYGTPAEVKARLKQRN